jgi:hypothetical protein
LRTQRVIVQTIIQIGMNMLNLVRKDTNRYR